MKQRTKGPADPGTKTKTEHRAKQTGRWVAICLFWLALWQLGAVLVGSSLLLPSPLETARTLGELAGERSFYLNIAWTLLRCTLAMLLSFAAGVCCAWLAYRHRWIRTLLALPVSFFKAVPVMAIIIYVILLMRADGVAVLVCFLMCFPVVYTNLLGGLDAVSDELLEVAEIYELDSSQRLRLLYLPALLTPIRASLQLIAGLSWKAVVAAEVLAVPAYSLGYPMLSAKYYLETPRLFAYIAVIVLLSIGFEKLICRLLVSLNWHPYTGSRLHRWLDTAARAADAGHAETRTGCCVDRKADAGHVKTRPVRRAERDADYYVGGTDFSAPTVEVRHVSKAFDGQIVLRDINLHLEAGCVTALMGPSGIGKTTLARMLAGLTLPDSGTILLDGAYRLSVLFQEDRLLPWLNVYDNLALGFLDRRRRLPHGSAVRLMTAEEIDRRVRKLAEALELTDALDKLPDELSGGMRCRAAMGRTFAPPSELLILDEPFRGLDEALRTRIIDRLWETETRGKTVLLITHRPEDCEQLADRKLNL